MKNDYKVLEHPADIGIEVQGIDIKEAFENAGYGLYDLMFDSQKIESINNKYVDLTSYDLESLLVKWLNEILYFFETEDFIGNTISISSIEGKNDEFRLKGRIIGETFSKEKHDFKIGVKAVTFHQLKIQKYDDNITIQVFFDI
jgi:SHS2 domain-containing protein